MSDNTFSTVSVTVELPAVAAMRIATAVCSRRGYAPIDDADAVEFVKKTIFDQLRMETLQYEADLAAQQARDSVYANPSDPLAYVQPVGPVPVGPVGPTGETGVTGATGA